MGDACDTGDDYDGDLVDDAVDSCPTIYNPADPVLGFQTDSDRDGRGDDRTGQDVVGICAGGPTAGKICLPAGTAADCGAGGSCVQSASAYCDPDSADDDGDGRPDDLVEFTSEVECAYEPGGLGAKTAEVGTFALDSFTIADDGTADMICVSGDPDPNNNPGLIEPCPVRDPGPAGDASCDTPGGGGGDGDCEAVPDGVADPGEEIALALTLVNQTVDVKGLGRAITNATVGIRALSPSIGCVTRGQTFVGTISGTGPVQVPSGALRFILSPATAQTVDVSRPVEADFQVTVSGDGIQTSTVDGTVSIFGDLDYDMGLPVTGQCGTPTAGAALGPAHNVPGALCEDFDTDRNGGGGIDGTVDFTRLFPQMSPTDPLFGVPDPNDDIIGNTVGGGPIPLGVAGTICSGDAAFSAARATCYPVPTENDWHLHSPYEGCDNDDSYDGGDPQFASSCAPDARAHSGFRSLHMGRHLNATNTMYDTYRFRQTSAFVLDPVNLGVGSTLEFWQIIRVCDDLCVGAGSGGTTAGGQVQISVADPASGHFQPWQRLRAVQNDYGSKDQQVLTVCEFDPTDDSLPPGDETMCGGAPQWSEQGDVYGNDITCLTDSDTGYNPNGDCGQTTNRTVDPNCSWVADPSCGSFLEHGSVGTGVWARTQFDLSDYEARRVRLRMIFEGGGGWGFGESRSFLEPEPGYSPYFAYGQDEGWYIDDIRLTNVRTSAALIPDPDDGTAACPAQGDPANCGTISIQIAGSVVDPVSGERVLFAPSQVAGSTALLDARMTAADDDPNTPSIEGACDAGVLEYRWSELDEATGTTVRVVQDFSPAGDATVRASEDTLYRVDVRCSSDPSCTASDDVRLLVYTGEGSDVASAGEGATPAEGYRGLYIDHDPSLGWATLSWEARPQPPGMQGWDLFRTAVTGSGTDLFPGEQFTGAPFASTGSGPSDSCDLPNGAAGTRLSFVDKVSPPPGEARLYMVAHSSVEIVAPPPLGVRP
ncbi:MAG TPA: hypothetical protein VNI57_00880, partial [Candidatus Saccharimonadales bacterium]|nr:hypothetical protein [Candidatus Saccharimonadales bacterium]